jgi:hypothetical protein
MKRIATFLVLGALVSACGGGGTAPSPPGATGAIEGTWHGTITFTKPAPMTVQTTWTFTTLANTAGHGFEATASWMGITTRAMTATVIGAQFSTNGAYPSPLGCDGLAGGNGTADPRVIDASFSGSSSCDAVFEGHMTLTR